jgi:hypothetical protein
MIIAQKPLPQPPAGGEDNGFMVQTRRLVSFLQQERPNFVSHRPLNLNSSGYHSLNRVPNDWPAFDERLAPP